MPAPLALAALLLALPQEPSSDGAPPPEPDLVQELIDRLGLYGDMRLRYEDNFELDGKPDRTRGRARVRLGARFDITDELSGGLRVITGNPNDANSPHEDFGDGFASDDISFDRYFLSYAPDWCPGLDLTAGKFDHGVARNPVYGELLWDADIQPEGVAAKYAFGAVAGLESLDLYLADYVLIEQSLASEATVFVAQLAGRLLLGESTQGRFALAWYDYGDTTPDGSSVLLDANQGNAVVDTSVPADGTADDFASDFSILNPILALDCTAGDHPLTFSAEWIHNLDAATSEDSGYALGAALGRSKEKGDWKAWYQFQHLEQDAFFAPFGGDDFLLTTNATNHVAGVSYRAADRVELRLWSLVSARDNVSPGIATADSDSEQWRVRFDVNVKL